MKKLTHDRARFYTPERLGEKRSVTPEGFLVCHDVPIARTGTQLYTPAEIPIDPGPDGLIRIERLPEEVFREETIASFEGKAVTVEHPSDFVTPENWKKLSIGTVQNVRRGDGIEDDLLFADFVITDPAGIEYINKELPEVSAGYEAEYTETEPGRGLQRGIVGNHVALVERGRAGPRCSIQDKEPDMTTKTKDKSSLLARLMKAIKIGDADEIKATMADAEEEETEEQKAEREKKEKKETSDSIAKLKSTVDALAKVVAKLTADADPDDDEKKKTEDDDEEDDEKEKTADDILEAETAAKANAGTVLSGDSMKQIVSRAEILAPGIAIQTGDSANTKGAAKALQRKALEIAHGTKDGKEVVDTFLMGRDIKTLTGDALAGVFAGAAELARVRNNDKGYRSGVSTQDFGRASSVADINARNKAFWANRSA